MFSTPSLPFSIVVLSLNYFCLAEAGSKRSFRPSSSSSHAAVITNPPLLRANSSTLHAEIPGLISEDCVSGTQPPCVAVCHKHDETCRRAASSISRTCWPQWDRYISNLVGSTVPSSGAWSWVTSVHTSGAGVYTSVWSEYTSFSTVSTYTVVGYSGTAITPVYALGTPITHESVYTSLGWSESWLTAPPPTCRFNAVSWPTPVTYVPPSTSEAQSTSCGQCTIYGGTVELLWWPSPTDSTAVSGSPTSAPTSTMSIVTNGVTLVYPTVYISLHKVYASNYCSPVGGTYKSTLLAMNPTDVSTQYHFGGKAAATGANSYAPLNYSQLTGLPDVSVYEHQESCIYRGCPTIYPTPLSPTLVVPPQIRSLDPAWAGCVGALGGLIDPPVALQARATIGAGSMASGSVYQGASPHRTRSANLAEKTWTLETGAASATEKAGKSLAAILGGSKANNSDGTRENKGSKSTIPGDEASDTSARVPYHSPDRNRANESSNGAGNTAELSETKPTRTRNTVDTKKTQEHSTSRATVSEENPTIGRDGRTTDHAEPSDVVSSRKGLEGSPNIEISTNTASQYVVNGQTFAPGSPITIDGNDGQRTYRMLTSSSRTYIAIGISFTILLDQSDGKPASKKLDKDLQFTRASNGNFVLHGTTLTSGQPITIGRGVSQTTLRVTSISSTAAVILDGSMTAMLGHAEPTSLRLPKIYPAPVETKAPETMGLERPAVSSTLRSGGLMVRVETWFVVVVLVMVLAVHWGNT